MADRHDGFPARAHRSRRSRVQMLGEGRARKTSRNCAIPLVWTCPSPSQYGHYLAGVLRGNLGESFRFQQPVRASSLHYPATLELAFVALLVCAAIGIPAGILAADRRGTATDHAVGVFTLLGLSVPNFALGPVLILVFSVLLGWLPVSGRGGLGTSGLAGGHAGRGAGGDSHAHGAHLGDRGAFERLRAHRARQGPVGIRGAVSPRVSQRADSDPHDPRLAIRHAARRRHRHRDDFFLARASDGWPCRRLARATIRCCRAAFC